MPDRIIFFVDDSESLIRQAQVVLSQEGFRVIPWSAEDGALEVIREHRPDLVIINLWLEDNPDCGWRLYEEMRLAPTTSELPVILTFDDKGDLDGRVERLNRDMRARGLKKPYDWDVLASVARSMTRPAAAGGSGDADAEVAAN